MELEGLLLLGAATRAGVSEREGVRLCRTRTAWTRWREWRYHEEVQGGFFEIQTFLLCLYKLVVANLKQLPRQVVLVFSKFPRWFRPVVVP